MVSITNKGGSIIGSVPSGIVSQKENTFTLELKDKLLKYEVNEPNYEKN